MTDVYSLDPNRNPYYLAAQQLARQARMAAAASGPAHAAPALGAQVLSVLGTLSLATLVAVGTWTGIEALRMAQAQHEVTPASVLSAMADRVDATRELDQSVSADKRHEAAHPSNMFFVVKVTPASGGQIYSVRSGRHFGPNKQTRQPLASNAFRHGGLSTEPANAHSVAGPFPTAADATRHLSGMIEAGSVGNPGLAGGFHGKVGGQWVTIDDWGQVDMQVLRDTNKCRGAC